MQNDGVYEAMTNAYKTAFSTRTDALHAYASIPEVLAAAAV